MNASTDKNIIVNVYTIINDAFERFAIISSFDYIEEYCHRHV